MATEIRTVTCAVGRHDWYYLWDAQPFPTVRWCGRCRFWEDRQLLIDFWVTALVPAP